MKKFAFYLFQIYYLIWILARKFVHLILQHKAGLSRQQLQICSLEDKIPLDNPVRFVEAVVKCVSLEALDFTVQKKRLTCLLLFF